MNYSILRHQAKDTVGVAVTPIQAGEISTIKDIASQECSTLLVKENILIFHKVALKDIAKQSDVIEYGESIGEAITDIGCGEYIHIHNMRTRKW